MRKYLNIILEAQQNWPETISGYDLAHEIEHRQMHHTPEDFEDGDIFHNIVSYGTYHLRHVPIADLNLGLYSTNDSLIGSYSEMPSETAPPIIMSPEWGIIIDGNHRGEAAVKRGDKTVLAYVGDPATYNPPEDEDEDEDEWRPTDD